MGIRSIHFVAKLVGKGIVNYDSNDAKWNMKKVFSNNLNSLDFKNSKFAKHEFYHKRDSNGDLMYSDEDKKYPKLEAKIKISSECLRSYIFGEDIPFHNADLCYAPKALIKFISSKSSLLKGYLFPSSNNLSIKRTSAVKTCDAVQCNNAISDMEVSSSRTPKEMNDNEKSTSLYYKESVGDIEYEFEGAVDIRDLQFISLDSKYDRMAVPPDYEDGFIENLSKELGSSVSKHKYYKLKTAIIDLPEEGILLTGDQVVVLIQEFFKRLLNLYISKTLSFARIESLKIRFVREPKFDLTQDDNFIQINCIDDIKIDGKDIHIFYEAMDEDYVKSLYESMKKPEKIKEEKPNKKNTNKKINSTKEMFGD